MAYSRHHLPYPSSAKLSSSVTDEHAGRRYGTEPREKMSSRRELVSVIIPAYNAQASLDATLRSVRSQTHENLEIFVIDDGSTDATRAIMEYHARGDKRIILLEQPNSGVAAARNAGLRVAKGRYFAPLDADDLWIPEKIERQLQEVYAYEETVGIVYSWYATIDESDLITGYDCRMSAQGNVLEALCDRNIVGNGSTPLILRAAALAVGGYDPELRRRNAEGCEDYKLYFQVAEHFPFVLIRECLVGYRVQAGSMSQHTETMIRSRGIVTEEVGARHPHLAARLRRGNTRARRSLLTRNIRAHQFRRARSIFVEMFAADPLFTIEEISILVWRALRATFRYAKRAVTKEERLPFPIGNPSDQ